MHPKSKRHVKDYCIIIVNAAIHSKIFTSVLCVSVMIQHHWSSWKSLDKCATISADFHVWMGTPVLWERLSGGVGIDIFLLLRLDTCNNQGCNFWLKLQSKHFYSVHCYLLRRWDFLSEIWNMKHISWWKRWGNIGSWMKNQTIYPSSYLQFTGWFRTVFLKNNNII